MNGQTDVLKLLTKNVKKQHWTCLFTGFVAGIVTHIYMLTRKLPNWDDLTTFGTYGVGREHGRWMIPKLFSLAGEWSAPALNGMLTIIFIAIAACFILAALELKTLTSAVLLPLVMVTFPGVASSMTFMYVSHIYGAGLLFGCAGAWLIHRFRYGCIPGTALLILCIATYQSYICLAAGILVLALVLWLLKKKELKQVIRQGIISLVSLAAAMGLYVLLSKYVFGGLSDYKGISTMGQLNIFQLPIQIGRAYKRILEYFVIKPWSFISDGGQRLNILVVLGIAVAFFFFLWKLEIYKEKGRVIWLCLLIFLLPLALSSIYVIAPQANATVLTLYQYFMVYVVLIAFLELFMKQELLLFSGMAFAKPAIGLAVMGMIFLVAYDNYVLTNSAYFRMDIAFTRIHSFYERLYIRVTQQEGYAYGDQIVILGDWWPERNILSSHGMDIERYEEFEGIAMENGLFTTGVRQKFLRIYLGIDYPHVSAEKMQELMETEEFVDMPDYPAQGCVRKIDGIWVVRVAD